MTRSTTERAWGRTLLESTWEQGAKIWGGSHCHLQVIQGRKMFMHEWTELLQFMLFFHLTRSQPSHRAPAWSLLPTYFVRFMSANVWSIGALIKCSQLCRLHLEIQRLLQIGFLMWACSPRVYGSLMCLPFILRMPFNMVGNKKMEANCSFLNVVVVPWCKKCKNMDIEPTNSTPP